MKCFIRPTMRYVCIIAAEIKARLIRSSYLFPVFYRAMFRKFSSFKACPVLHIFLLWSFVPPKLKCVAQYGCFRAFVALLRRDLLTLDVTTFGDPKQQLFSIDCSSHSDSMSTCFFALPKNTSLYYVIHRQIQPFLLHFFLLNAQKQLPLFSVGYIFISTHLTTCKRNNPQEATLSQIAYNIPILICL